MENMHCLLQIMDKLRDPKNGCPWDQQQVFETIVPYTIEEAYEVADAIERKDMDDLCDELGDLLFQVVFHGQIAKEAGHFDFNDVTKGICDKLIRRHPHVFGDEQIDTADDQTTAWEKYKSMERTAKSHAKGQKLSALDGVSMALPALTRAAKLSRHAARVGFDWPSITGVMGKLKEELGEVEAELGNDGGEGHNQRLAEEIGDLLFACVNLARHTHIDPETALRAANSKFTRRFQAIEQSLEAHGGLNKATLEQMDAAWNIVKAKENNTSGNALHRVTDRA